VAVQCCDSSEGQPRQRAEISKCVSHMAPGERVRAVPGAAVHGAAPAALCVAALAGSICRRCAALCAVRSLWVQTTYSETGASQFQ